MAQAHQQTTGERGRHADSPLEMPAKGWKDILWRTYGEFSKDRVTLIAAAVTYYLLLSLFPTLAAFVSIYGLFADPQTVSEHVDLLSSIVPEGGMEIIREQLTSLTSGGGTTLGLALVVSLAIALWSANSGVKTMFEAMNVAYDEKEERGFVKLNLVALAFTLAGMVGGILLIGTAVVVPVVLNLVGLGSGTEWLVQIGSYVALLLVLLTGVAALYRFGPSRQKAQWRWITPGAVVAVIVILAISVLFSWYTANFGSYDETYGSLGGLIALLTWMWISVTVLIAGAELNSEAEKQTREDSTVGQDDPMGQRDAAAADTLGRAAGRSDGTGDRKTSSPDQSLPGGADLSSKSAEWQAGYRAALNRSRPAPRFSIATLALAVPASLALSALNKRGSRKR